MSDDLRTPETIPYDITKVDYEPWMSIHNNKTTAKLTERKFAKIC